MAHIEEKRQYIRFNAVFPVEFQLVGKEDREPLSELYEGFTRDVGKGGMGIFAKTLKDKDKEFFSFVPHETKLKLIINIPLDKEPIESFATVEWIEKEPGPLIDTYLFGVSYDFINEAEYEKIVYYIKWLYLKPKLIALLVVLLTAALAFSFVTLVKTYQEKRESEQQLTESQAESQRAVRARMAAEKEKAEMEDEFKSAKSREMVMQAALEKLIGKKKALEEASRVSREDKKELQEQLEELAADKTALEEQIEEVEQIEEEIEARGITESGEAVQAIPQARIEAEVVNYNKFRELILHEKIQSLSAYVSTHPSSIYQAAALFALAELRYKDGERTLAEVNYTEVIESYPRSKYALYASHRLDQLRARHNYEHDTLRNFYDEYNLPELLDYRNIEPYIR